MSQSVARQIAGPRRLSAAEPKDRWRDLNGTEPPLCNRAVAPNLNPDLRSLAAGPCRLIHRCHVVDRDICHH